MSRSAIMRCLRIVCSLPMFAFVILVTLVCCGAVSQVAGWGIAIFLAAFGVALVAFVMRWVVSEGASLGDIIAVSVVSVIIVALLLPAILSTGHDPSKRMLCSNNLKQTIFAMHNYHDTYKAFPPAYIEDQDKDPRHSWRVSLLPFMELGALYEQYDVNEAWNSEANLATSISGPNPYRCPGSDSPEIETNYLAIVGSETVWPGGKGTAFRDILDGVSNTIAIVENHHTGIRWTEPRDLKFDNMDWQINGTSQWCKISSLHPGGVNVALADGSIRFVSETIDQELLRSLISSQGGEPIDDW